MSRVLALAEELAAGLPPRPRIAAERWVATVQAARFAMRPRALWRLAGRAAVDERPLEVLTDLGGDALAYWSDLLFAAPPAREAAGRHRPLARLDAGHGAMLALVGHHRALRRYARRQGYVTVPTWLDTGLAVHGSLAATLAALPCGRRSRESDLRRIRRARLTYEVVRDATAVEGFLRDWYLPFVHARWGDSCVGLDGDWMRRAPRYCDLLWVLRGEERVAGLLLEPQGEALRMVVVGMQDAAARNDGALAAVYYFAITEAVRRGCRWLRTGGARPVLSDGVLAFKRKWGAGLRAGRQQDYLALGVRTWSPTLRALFARHPVVAESETGTFLAVTDPDAVDAALLDLPGVAGVLSPERSGGWRTSAR